MNLALPGEEFIIVCRQPRDHVLMTHDVPAGRPAGPACLLQVRSGQTAQTGI
jgi:hypothetical protein